MLPISTAGTVPLPAEAAMKLPSHQLRHKSTNPGTEIERMPVVVQMPLTVIGRLAQQAVVRLTYCYKEQLTKIDTGAMIHLRTILPSL